MYVLNAGATRTILKGYGTLTFNIQDVLNSRAREFTYNSPNYTQYSFMQFAPQQFTLSFTYRFKQGDNVDFTNDLIFLLIPIYLKQKIRNGSS